MRTAVLVALLAAPAVADDRKVLIPDKMAVGDVGRLSTQATAAILWHTYKIVSVKPDYFVVRVYHTGNSTNKPLNYLVIRGLPTKDLADDQEFKPTGTWKVVETQKVELAGGGVKTLLALEPVR
jgi:hypothetical protein